MTFYDMTWLERLLFLKRIKGGGSGHEETTTSNTFVTDMVAPLRKLLLSFAPKQSGSGDPSPTNVRPISGWNGVNVVRSGVNLFDGEWESGSINSSGQPAGGGSNIRPKHKIFVLPSKTYAISHSSGSRNIYWYTYKADGSFSRYIGLKNTSSSTLATNADEYYLWCYQYNNTSAPTDMQVEISPKTDYEPYAGQTYSVSWQTEAGTVYGGTLDMVSGVLTVTDGYIASYSGETLPSTWISDRDVYASGTTPTNGAEVVYKLATPKTYQLTPQQINTLIGTNVITTDANVEEIIYLKKAE